jgi:FtsH-binding integral membrane protein
MSDTTTVPGLNRAEASRTVFGQTMGLVAVTTGCFAAGSFAGRDLTAGWGWVFFVAALASLLSMKAAVRRSEGIALALLFVFGSLLGLATAPTVAYYASANPRLVWQAGAATALFVAGLGAVGYGARKDLSGLGRAASWALVALIVFGVVAILAQLPGLSLGYAVVGLVIFGALTVVDFQRLRLTRDLDSAPLLAASIFLDALNVFLFFLTIFGNEN